MEKSHSMKFAVKKAFQQYTMFFALVGLMLIFSLLTGGTFMMPRNLSNLLLQTSHIAILACAVVLVIVAGHIDLSIGSVVGFTGAIAAILQVNYSFGTIPAILVTLLVGALIGAWQGYWVAFQEVPAFIVTLAGMMAFKGGLLLITKGATIAPMNDSFKAISQQYLPNIPGFDLHITTIIVGIAIAGLFVYSIHRNRLERKKYGFDLEPARNYIIKQVLAFIGINLPFVAVSLYNGLPYVIVLVLIVGYIYTIIATKTKFGRYVFAIGGNNEAAQLSGIETKMVNMKIFISMGILGALGGIVYTSRLNAATAAAGAGMELDVIASAIIGGTSTLGGEGTIFGAIIGALVMATLNNGMSLMGAQPDVQYITKGLILLLAVWVDISSRKNR